MYINEIFQLDEILNEEKKVIKERGINITNVSHWNTSQAYQNFMLKKIILEQRNNIFEYVYSYDFDKSIRWQIVSKFGMPDEKECMCLLTPSSTVSIINIINYLKRHGYKKLCILEPAYFSVEQSCIIFNLKYEKKSLQYRNGYYTIPQEYIISKRFDAIWVTSPIYSSGILFDESQIEVIKTLIDSRILVIADETLALPGQELCRKIPISSHFFSIYCPHKPIFVNSIKFSAIVCPIDNDDFFEHWIDVLGGGLLSSNITAVFHFLSDNYNYCTKEALKWFKNTLSVIENVLKQFQNVYCDTRSIGSYKMIILKSDGKNNLNSTQNVIDTIQREYVSYIPGIYHGYRSIHKNCFRVNLSTSPAEMQSALYRILNSYL